MKSQLKYILPATAQILAVLTISVFAMRFINRTGVDLKQATLYRLPMAEQSAIMEKSMDQIISALWSIYGAGIDIAERNRLSQEVKDTTSRFQAAETDYMALGKGNTSDETLKELDSRWSLFQDSVVRTMNQLAKNDPRFDEMGKYYILSKTQPAAAPLNQTLTKLRVERMEGEKEQNKKSLSDADYATRVIPLFAVLAFFSSLASIWITRSVMRLTKKMVKTAHALASGAVQVTKASEYISTQSRELAESATQQASVIQQTASALEEMSATIGQNAENSLTSKKVANDSSHVAGKGAEVMQEMLHAMDQIKQSNQEIMVQIDKSIIENSQIVDLIGEIGTKTKVINDIVFQTKLLSFNASVEAARAGEYGKGFSVVAEEIGKLAQMSGKAAQEISSMLTSSITRVQAIATETKTNVEQLLASGQEKITSGSKVANRCRQVLEEIVKNVDGVKSRVEEIYQTSQQQALSIAEINKAMSQLEQVTHQNDKSSQQAATSSQELLGAAKQLSRIANGLLGTVQTEDEAKPGADQSTPGANSRSHLKIAS